MISFPVFSELEAKRDEINGRFHRETEPLLIERFQQFGFERQSAGDDHHMVLAEKSTGNHYLLSIGTYSLTVTFEHVRTGESLQICEISNFSLSAHSILNIMIESIDSWLQYGIVYDYHQAQGFVSLNP